MKNSILKELTRRLNPDLDIIAYKDSITINIPPGFNPEDLWNDMETLEIQLGPFVQEVEERMKAEPPAAGPDYSVAEALASGEAFAYNVGDSSADIPQPEGLFVDDLLRPSRLNGTVAILKGRSNKRTAQKAQEKGLDKVPFARWGRSIEFKPYEDLLVPILP